MRRPSQKEMEPIHPTFPTSAAQDNQIAENLMDDFRKMLRVLLREESKMIRDMLHEELSKCRLSITPEILTEKVSRGHSYDAMDVDITRVDYNTKTVEGVNAKPVSAEVQAKNTMENTRTQEDIAAAITLSSLRSQYTQYTQDDVATTQAVQAETVTEEDASKQIRRSSSQIPPRERRQGFPVCVYSSCN